MSNKTKVKSRKKKVFHAPERIGDARPIPRTGVNQALSILGLLAAAGLTVFSIVAVMNPYQGSRSGPIELYGSFRLILVFFTVVDWILIAGFRFACRAIPLEMWRLSARTKKGVVRTEGRILKTVTLALELETTACFAYITASLYLGYNPSDAIVLTWVAAIVLTVVLFRKQAHLAADGIIR